MTEVTYLPQVLCEIVNDQALLNTLIIGVPDVSGNRQFLRVGQGAVEKLDNGAFLQVGIVELDRKQRKALIELPQEADSGASRLWVSFDNFRKKELPR